VRRVSRNGTDLYLLLCGGKKPTWGCPGGSPHNRGSKRKREMALRLFFRERGITLPGGVCGGERPKKKKSGTTTREEKKKKGE